MPKITKEISDWFAYPDDPYNGRVLVRLPKAGEVDAIREKAREMRVKSDETVLRFSGMREAVAMIAVKDWEQFFDADDQLLKCTPANIAIMCLEKGFLDFVDECIADLEKRAEERSKAAMGN